MLSIFSYSHLSLRCCAGKTILEAQDLFFSLRWILVRISLFFRVFSCSLFLALVDSSETATPAPHHARSSPTLLRPRVSRAQRGRVGRPGRSWGLGGGGGDVLEALRETDDSRGLWRCLQTWAVHFWVCRCSFLARSLSFAADGFKWFGFFVFLCF